MTNIINLRPDGPVEPGRTHLLYLAAVRRRRARIRALVLFVAAAAATNTATFWIGVVPVGFGTHAAAGTLAAGAVGGLAASLRRKGPALALVGITCAAVVSTLLAGPVGLAWGIAYLAAEAVGALTWQPLDALDAAWWQVFGALVLASLVDTIVFVALLDWWLPLSVAGQMLAKAEAVLAAGAVVLVGRRLRAHLRPAGSRLAELTRPAPAATNTDAETRDG